MKDFFLLELLIQIAMLKILLAAAPTSKAKTESVNILADLLPEEMPLVILFIVYELVCGS